MAPYGSETLVTSSNPAEVVLAAWVHVSDVHFGHGSAGHQWDQRLVVEALRRDIRTLLQGARVPAPTHVFVTGDIAFSGGARPPVAGRTEYELAARWLEDLLRDLALGPERLFLVPGNHDVDRAMDDDVANMIELARDHRPRKQLDDLLERPAHVVRLRQRMARYYEFAGARVRYSACQPFIMRRDFRKYRAPKSMRRQ